MTIIRLTLLWALLGFLPAPASGQPASSPAEWINDLRLGGYVIVFRHGATTSDQANTDSVAEERLRGAPSSTTRGAHRRNRSERRCAN